MPPTSDPASATPAILQRGPRMVRPDITPTLHTLTRAEEEMVRSGPNLLHQYAGALVTQPGVVPDAEGHPSIRGARQTEVGYMVNGILIVEPSTGGFATNLSTVGMDRLNLYTGGYRAELGSAAGGMHIRPSGSRP